MERDNLALDRYILKQSPKPNPKICYLPTASGDLEADILRFYEAFSTLECRPSYLSLFRLPTADLEGFILDKDIVYVGGGNTRSMLALWREWGLDGFLRKAYENGVIGAGRSTYVAGVGLFVWQLLSSLRWRSGPATFLSPHVNTK